MLKSEFKWSVLVFGGLLLLVTSLLVANPQGSQNRDDNSITTAIQAKLFQDPALKTQDIHVSTQNGVVTLTGTVDTEGLQDAVDRVASMQPGVVKVIDSLNVSAPADIPPAGEEDSASAPAQSSQPLPQPPQTSSQPENQHRPFGNSAPQDEVVPPTLMMSSGTMVSVRLNQALSSDQNRTGDGFTATLDQPVVVNGWVVARRGQTVQGRVDNARRAGRVKGTSQLEVALTELTLVNGHQLPIQTQLMHASGGTSKGRDAEDVGTTTGVGAMIGAIAGEGEGAGIGAGIGAAVGVAGVLLTRGRPTVIPPEALLTFRLVSAADISTLPGQAAFRPVTQQDYPQDALRGRPDRIYQNRPPYGYPVYWGYYGWPRYYYPYGGWRPGWYGPGFVGVYRFGGGRREWRGEGREWRGDRDDDRGR